MNGWPDRRACEQAGGRSISWSKDVTGSYIVMAYIVMVYIVMAYIVMAYIVVAYIAMAWSEDVEGGVTDWVICGLVVVVKYLSACAHACMHESVKVCQRAGVQRGGRAGGRAWV